MYSTIAAMASIYCLGESFSADIERKKYLYRYMIIFIFITLLGTSAGSNIAFLVGFSVVGVMQKSHKRYIYILIVICALLILYVSGSLHSFWWDIMLYGKTEDSLIQLGGRRSMWNIYWELIKQKPILGHGFGVISRLGDKFGTVSTTSAHNGIIEIMLGTGMTGITVMALWLVKLFKDIAVTIRANSKGAIGSTGAFIVASANNMTMPVYGGIWSPVVTAFLVFYALFILFVLNQRISIKAMDDRNIYSNRT